VRLLKLPTRAKAFGDCSPESKDAEHQNRILTLSELSEYLNVHRTTIYRMLREEKLPGFRVGGDWRFHLDTIEQWQRDQMKDNTRKPD
jgi:excisionase family DNA binding protein